MEQVSDGLSPMPPSRDIFYTSWQRLRPFFAIVSSVRRNHSRTIGTWQRLQYGTTRAGLREKFACQRRPFANAVNRRFYSTRTPESIAADEIADSLAPHYAGSLPPPPAYGLLEDCDELELARLDRLTTQELYSEVKVCAAKGMHDEVTIGVEYLMRKRGEQPSLTLYAALILANVSHDKGSAIQAATWFDNMLDDGIEPDSALCHDMLAVSYMCISTGRGQLGLTAFLIGRCWLCIRTLIFATGCWIT